MPAHNRVVFLCGHGSDMNGSKAMHLEAWAQRRGQSFLRFDYSGHGQSDGDFLQTNISDWTRDTINMIDAHTDGPQIVVGSSLGGWIMLIWRWPAGTYCGPVGIAAAPDFTEELIWNPLDEAAKADFQASGQISFENPYADDPVVYPYHLIEDGRQHLRLQAPLADHCTSAFVAWHARCRGAMANRNQTSRPIAIRRCGGAVGQNRHAPIFRAAPIGPVGTRS